jgi:hypothetical protein
MKNKDADYWKKRYRLAEKYINESPCDPDITKAQYKAYLKWIEFKTVSQKP